MTSQQRPDSEFTSMWVKAQPMVNSFVFSAIRDAHSAEDVLQEIAAAAVADFEQYDRERPFLNWVLGIARFRVLNHYRAVKRDRLVFDDATLGALAEAHESLEPAASERRQALRECLTKVHDRGRRALSMRYAENMPVTTIAQRWKSTPNAISLLLLKTRRSLAKCIEERLAREGNT